MIAWAAILSLAALAAAISGAEPTTVAWIDAAERFVAVGMVALAGLRTRRWTLVTGSALVTVFASGAGIILGVGALLGVVVLTVIDKRSRIVGAVVAGIIALLSLFLSVPGPLGTETIVALAATVPIVVSGYRIYVSGRSGRRRKLRQTGVIVVAVIAGCLLATGVAAATSFRHIQSAMDSVQDGLAAAERGDNEQSAESFRHANTSFGHANRIIGSIWASSGKLVPIVGANLAAVQDSVNAGEMLTERAGVMVGDLDFSSVQLQGGGVDLEKLSELALPLEATTESLREVDQTLSDITSPWLASPLKDKITDLKGRVGSAREQSETASLAVDRAPAILGSESPRTYLFLFGNPAELRDLGGHIGNWAEVRVDNGRIKLVRVGGPLDLVIPPEKAPKDLSERFPASLIEMSPTRFPHNWGSSRDLPTVAKLAAELFPISSGRGLDGVVYADVKAFAALLSITGPMKVPDLSPPLELTQHNAAQFLTLGQFQAFQSESAAGDALEELIHTMFDKLTSTRLPSPQVLGELFAPLVSEGGFRMATIHRSDTDLLARLGLIGSVRTVRGGDMLAVINRNAGPSKIDSFLKRDIAADITWNPQTGGVQSKVTVTLQNGAPATGLNRTVYGNDASVPDGTNLTDVAILSPLRLQSAKIGEMPAVVHPQKEGTYWRYTVRVAVPPGDRRVIVYDLDGSVDPGPHYVLSFNGQSLLNPGDAVIRLRSTEGRVAVAGEPKARSKQSVSSEVRVRVGESLDKIFVWRSEGS